MYLFSKVDMDDVSSSLFKTKNSAIIHISRYYPEYKIIAENQQEDIQCWRKLSGEVLLLEKLKVED